METLEAGRVQTSAAGRLDALFAEQGLRSPPLPAHLVSETTEVGPGIFLAGPWGRRLRFDVGAHLAALDADRSDRFLVALVGHGVNSHLLHYFLVREPLAVFVVRRWGNVYDDREYAARRIAGAFAAVDEMIGTVERLATSGMLESGRWLVVVDTEEGVQRCGWSDLSSTSIEGLVAPAGAPALFTALMDLRGRGRPGA